MFLGKNGRMVIMHYDDDKITFTTNEIQQYKERLVNKCFAILGIYEDCEKDNNFKPFSIYVERLKREFVGFYNNTQNIQIISIINILTDLQLLNELKQNKVKSLTFHIISVVQKIKEV